MNVQLPSRHLGGDIHADDLRAGSQSRASRTIPFVSKATGVPLARLASLVMVGKRSTNSHPSRG